MLNRNYIQLAGNLATEPLSYWTATATEVTSFTLAVNQRSDITNRKETFFIKVNCIGKIAASIFKQNIKKGDNVFIDGQLKWLGENNFAIKAEKVELIIKSIKNSESEL